MAGAALFLCALASTGAQPPDPPDVFDRVTHGYAVSDAGVKIHYATLGEGPLIVMIHGFPDFWYSWRHQMAALADRFQVVAIDQRGYNLSDKPKGVESYDMRLLVGDVAAVIRHLGRDKATIVGHDWGGMVAWQFAMQFPQTTETLVVLNLPHPNGLLRELRTNKEQIANSEYARTFQTKPPTDPTVFFGRPMTPQTLSGWVRDPAARKRYVEAFERSDFDAMLNYYKRNTDAAGVAEGEDAGAHVPRSRRPGTQRCRPVGHVELAREGPDAGHHTRRRPLRPAGRRGSCHVNDEVVADHAQCAGKVTAIGHALFSTSSASSVSASPMR
jgi:pimeloyl-ACP methyl ester carboxylesterase